MINLDDLLACYLSGQMSEKQWVEWCADHPELQEMHRKHWEVRQDNDRR